jgi:UDP-N-acetylmuramate--alanine ligase
MTQVMRTSLQNLAAAPSNWNREKPFSDAQISSAHFVGICGSGMKALAEMMSGLGWKITGSDLQPSNPTLRAMQKQGLRVHVGHHDRFLPRDVDVLVYSPAVSPANPERRLATRLKIPQMSYSQMLGHLMQGRVGVAIAGTHGKSTTTAMTATVLADAQFSASAVIGAQLCGSGLSGWAGEDDLFVVESCEYQRSFLDLRPTYAAILGIEPDHFDYYRDFDETKAAFAEFARLLPQEGVLVIRGDCPASVAAAQCASAHVVSFSQQAGADWWATDQRCTAGGTWFRVFHQGDFFTEISLQIPGEHNLMNALAAVALSHYAGATSTQIRESLRDFSGICRRFERVGSWRGVTLVDDYAHHPTAVQATLDTARESFGRRRIWCVFQPHQVSRTQALMQQFAESFSSADEILIAPIFEARENPGHDAETAAIELTSRIAMHGPPARFCHSLDQIMATIEDETRPGDVLITMGAGDIDRVHHELTRKLQRRHSA